MIESDDLLMSAFSSLICHVIFACVAWRVLLCFSFWHWHLYIGKYCAWILLAAMPKLIFQMFQSHPCVYVLSFRINSLCAFLSVWFLLYLSELWLDTLVNGIVIFNSNVFLGLVLLFQLFRSMVAYSVNSCIFPVFCTIIDENSGSALLVE